MRKFMLILWLACLVIAVVVGCSDDGNLRPSITRLEANVECGIAPVNVQFVAFVTGGNPTADPTGANAPLHVSWDFQDGGTANGSITSHRFNEPGDYSVLATVTDEDGDSDTMSIFVEVQSDSMFIQASEDTTVTASMAYFTAPTMGTSNGSGGSNIRQTVVFNEILAFNVSIIPNPVNGLFEPLLELHNPSTTQSVSLTNWSLTNDTSIPNKWRFAASTVLPPGGFLIIWVDNRSIAGPTHTNFHMTGNWAGQPENFVGAIYLYDSSRRLVDRVLLLNQHADVSFGHLPDASDDGLVALSVVADLCGFDPERGFYERFNFTWDMDDILGSVYPVREPRHVFNTDDVGDRMVRVTVFDTHTNVTRFDTVTVHVELPTR
ncbi:lamin tail domain-containing protein [bacterium]|nr:lamin tail domain-containing protein [bacterium]MBU1071887.1 lamin tail domain-containing protein [bacterium]MBU1676350.1 lamin tail domain-containing protein [bacterium]